MRTALSTRMDSPSRRVQRRPRCVGARQAQGCCDAELRLATGRRVTRAPRRAWGRRRRSSSPRRARVIPGGVNSPVRSWRAVGGNPVFIAARRGRAIIDADGRRVPRLRRLVGAADPRARASRRRRGRSPSAREPGRASARRPRSRSSWRELADRRAAVGRAGAAGQLRHRGDDDARSAWRARPPVATRS